LYEAKRTGKNRFCAACNMPATGAPQVQATVA
jgi:hypothetical protein